MGTSWSARIAGELPDAAAAIARALTEVVAQMSHWAPGSDLSRLNRTTPGSWRALPPRFSAVLATALEVAERSGGAFDPAMGALVDLWGFGPPGPRADVPSPGEIARALAGSGRRGIEHDAPLLRARRTAPVALDLSGIAKGHGVDAAADALRALGARDFLVEVGGELLGAGVRPDGQPWWVDVDPVPGAAVAPLRIALHGLAVATSGDQVRSFAAGGRRYPHTIDPRTGMPIDNGVASVTVLHPHCMLADAWATALTVLGPEAGIALAEREALAVQMLVRDGDGFREVMSAGLRDMLD